MNAKEKLLRSINSDIARLEKSKNDLEHVPVNLLSQMFPAASWFINWNDITVQLPMSFALIEQFKQAMIEQLPHFEVISDNQYLWSDAKRAGHFITYSYNGDGIYVRFDVAFRSEVDGSTCVLNPIGKEMKEVVTYEIVCSEDAAAEFSMPESEL